MFTKGSVSEVSKPSAEKPSSYVFSAPSNLVNKPFEHKYVFTQPAETQSSQQPSFKPFCSVPPPADQSHAYENSSESTNRQDSESDEVSVILQTSLEKSAVRGRQKIDYAKILEILKQQKHRNYDFITKLVELRKDREDYTDPMCFAILVFGQSFAADMFYLRVAVSTGILDRRFTRHNDIIFRLGQVGYSIYQGLAYEHELIALRKAGLCNQAVNPEEGVGL